MAATQQRVGSGCRLDFLDDPYILSAVVLLQMEPEGYSGADLTDLTLPQLRLQIADPPGDAVLFPAAIYRHMTWDGEGENLNNRLAIAFFLDNKTVYWAERADARERADAQEQADANAGEPSEEALRAIGPRRNRPS